MNAAGRENKKDVVLCPPPDLTSMERAGELPTPYDIFIPKNKIQGMGLHPVHLVFHDL